FSTISQNIKDDSKIAVYTGTVANFDGTRLESQGLDFDIKGKCKNVSNGKIFSKNEICHQAPGLIWGSSAALVVYRKGILKKVGMFDDYFFAYEEDVDLALRLSKLGYKTYYIPQAICYHLGGGTSSKMGNFRNIMDAKNWIYIILKTYSTIELLKNLPQIITERLRNLSGLTKQTIKIYRLKSLYILPLSIFKAYIPILINFPAMLRKRRQLFNLMEELE
ncbi:MAG TPA: glycosyltransferase family 2 protein, partial [Patescibacteria group bacterium]